MRNAAVGASQCSCTAVITVASASGSQVFGYIWHTERETHEVEAPVTRGGDVPVEDAGHAAVLHEEVSVVEVAVHDGRLREGRGPESP